MRLCRVLALALALLVSLPTLLHAETLSMDQITARLARYAPAKLAPAKGLMNGRVEGFVKKLISAVEGIDRLFWDQVTPDGYAKYQALLQKDDAMSKGLAKLMRINYGPWDRFRSDEPFYGNSSKPAGAAFYPEDLSPLAFEKALRDASPEQRDLLRSPYSIVRRDGGALVAEKYSKAYYDQLQDVANKLKAAASACGCKPLSKYLELRAVDLLSDGYYKSELQWMNTGDCPLEVVVGPYETYEDRLMGLKASFEAIIAVKDAKATKALAPLLDKAASVLDTLPLKKEIRDHLRPAKPKGITIADVAYTAGEARAHFQVSAYTLPNDERVTSKKGAKNVVLRNVIAAKYAHILKPIVDKLMQRDQQKRIEEGSFLDLVVMWNMAHAVGSPVIVLPDGHELNMKARLKERFNVMDVLRADAMSLVVANHLAEEGALPMPRSEAIMTTYLASIFMNVRYGPDSTHGFGKTLAYNYLAAEGAFKYDPGSGRFAVDAAKLGVAARMLASEVLTIMALGDYERAGQFIVRYGILSPEVKRAIEGLGDVPVDITPIYSLDQ
jgi:hypothetical protein